MSSQQLTGTIKSIDPASHMLSLNDGKSFTLGNGVSDRGLKAGQKVQVTYDSAGGANTATMVKKVQ